MAAVGVVIPARNEEQAIGRVLDAIPGWVREVVVVDNGSSDRTAEVARAHGATVVFEPRRGYGAACLAGIRALRGMDLVVFLDGDFSDFPEEMDRLVAPILSGECDLVIGSRTLGRAEPGSLTLPQRLGNALACGMLRLFFRQRCSDLGPFRAVRRSVLDAIGMDDETYGWTAQMQARAAKRGFRAAEVPVSYRPRIGRSKISGTLRGVLGAGWKIPSTILREAWRPVAPRRRVVVFARAPRPGRVKTRLIPALGAEGAVALHEAMARHTIDVVRAWARPRGAQVEVLPDGAQGEGDLGARMARVFRAAGGPTVIVGTDCPEISPALFSRAFSALARRDLVLGPARDGGYYLIGARLFRPALFEGVSWGGPDVLAQTLSRARRAGLSVTLLPEREDVDRPEDLGVWRRGAGATISVVVPARNEAAGLPACLERVCGLCGVETIVADGRSGDATREVARSFGARVVESAPGRAQQMNAGARAASGETLVFLHADTLLPPGWEARVRKTLSRPEVAAGAFTLRIDSPSRLLRGIEWTTRWRSERLGMPYGDQAIFLRRETFWGAGGYPDVPILEDLELVRQLRRKGAVVTLRESVLTSARFWQRKGILRGTLLNQLILLGHHLGLDHRRLARLRTRRRLFFQS